MDKKGSAVYKRGKGRGYLREGRDRDEKVELV
jgi:hypothetical protein